jgi:hypothetical protein
MKLTKELIAAGFAPPKDTLCRRLVIATVGENAPATPAGEKTGKTHWALCGPQPVLAIATDTGTEEVARKIQAKGREVYCKLVEVPKVPSEATVRERANIYEPIWNNMKEAVAAAIEDRNVRTLVIDTATEFWETCRLCRFGKLAQVMPNDYGPVNAEFRELIKSCYKRDDLVSIWLHKNKKEYAAKTTSKGTVDSWTGKWERAGFSDTSFLVDINAVNYFYARTMEDGSRDKGFGLKVLNSRQEMMDLEGLELEGPMNTFQMLATLAFPDSAEEEWI